MAKDKRGGKLAAKPTARTSDIRTRFTPAEIKKLKRDDLEAAALAVAAKISSRQGISEEESIRRAGLLMAAQSDAQLRKYILRNG